MTSRPHPRINLCVHCEAGEHPKHLHGPLGCLKTVAPKPFDYVCSCTVGSHKRRTAKSKKRPWTISSIGFNKRKKVDK